MGERRNSKHIYQTVPLSPHGDLKLSPIFQSANDVPKCKAVPLAMALPSTLPAGKGGAERGRGRRWRKEGSRDQANGEWRRKGGERERGEGPEKRGKEDLQILLHSPWSRIFFNVSKGSKCPLACGPFLSLGTALHAEDSSAVVGCPKQL